MSCLVLASLDKVEPYRVTSFVYHGFGIRGYQHVSAKYEGDEVIFKIR
jgi:hypothetical protein